MTNANSPFLLSLLRILTVLSFILVSGAVHAQAGANDPTFNPTDVGFGYSSGPNGVIEAIAVQPDGLILIGGNFTSYNDTARNGIARLDINGHVDTSFNPGAGASGGFYLIQAIAIYPPNAGPGLAGKILVGGELTAYDGTPRNGIARLNADGSLDTGFDPVAGADGAVEAITLQPDGRILIGGVFNEYDGTTRNGIARLNADGSLDTSFDPGTGVANNGGGSIVRTVALYPTEAGPGLAGKVLIGGGFTEYNGTVRNYIARLNADGSLDTDFDPGEEMAFGVSSILLQPDGQVLAAGSPTLARLNTDGSVDPSFTSTGSLIECMALQSDGKLLVGGMMFGAIVRRLNPDGSEDANVDVFAGLTTWVRAIALQPDGRVLIGGNFRYVDGVIARSIARLDTSLNIDLSFNPGTGADDSVEAIVPLADGKLLVGGRITRYNGTRRTCLARLNADGELDPGFSNPELLGDGVFDSNGLAVRAIAVYPSDAGSALAEKILVAGYFSNHDGNARNGISRLNTDGSVDLNFDPGTGVINDGQKGTIQAIALYPTDAGPGLAGKILVGGAFTEYDGTTRNRIARINTDGSLDSGFDPGTGTTVDFGDAEVRTIAIYPQDAGPELAGKILIGGSFTEYDGTPRNDIARLNADGSLDNGFDPGTGASGGFDPTVHAIAIYPTDAGPELAGKVLVVGGFAEYDGTPRNGIARLNLDGSLDMNFDPGTGANDRILSVVVQEADGKILIGGEFFSYNGIPRNAIARLNTDASIDPSFEPGTGAEGSIGVIARQPDGRTLIGGTFTSYNGTGRNRIARLLGGIDDCAGTPGGTALPGTPCDDGDPCTVNDTWDLSCNCVGEILTTGIILTPFDTLCVTGTAYALDGFATPSGGTWSGPGVEDNVFTPSGVGSFELSYTSTEACGIVQSSIEVVDTPSIELVSGQINNPCGTDPLVFEATPPGGTWSDIAQAGGVVERSCSERPDQGYVTYTFNAVNGGNCSANANYFTLQACANVFLGPDTTMCSNDAPLVLSVGGGNVYGSLSGMDTVVQNGPGVIGFFSPQKEPGVYTIIGQASGAMACQNADTLLVTIIAQPQISTGTYGPLCSTAAPVALSGTPSNGTWTGVGVSDDQFDPAIAGPGTWILTYTVTVGSCSNSDSTTIVVDAAPNAGIGGSVELCATSAPINLFVYLQGNPQQGGLWSYQFGATSGIFMPGVSPEGTYTYTATGAGPCVSATAQLEVNVMDLQLDPILAPDTESIPGTYIFSALPVLIDADSIVWSFPADWSWGNDPDHFDGEALLVPPAIGGVYSVCAIAYGGGGCIGIEQCFQVIVTGIAAHGTTGPRMAIFPNPNNGQFTITMDGLPTIGRVMVLDAMGKVLQQRVIGGTSTMQMDLGDLASGMYHVRIETEREVMSLPVVVGR